MSCNQEEEVVVKWFFNASTTPFYQWVPALDVGPQVHYYVYIWSSLCDKCWMVVEASLAKLSLHKRNVLTRQYLHDLLILMALSLQVITREAPGSDFKILRSKISSNFE